MIRQITTSLKHEIETFISLCFHKPGDARKVYAIQQPDGSYYSGDGPVTEFLALQHLKQKLTLGSYQLTDDNKVKWQAWDVDVKRCYRASKISKSNLEQLRKEFKRLALELYDAACGQGRRAYISTSGRRGCHVYLFFKSMVPAPHARALGEKVVEKVEIPKGVSIEVFPKQVRKHGGYGSLLKMPWSKHQLSGKGTKFLNRKCEEIKVKPSDIIRNPTSTIPDEKVELPSSNKAIDFKIRDKLPPLFDKLLQEDRQIEQLYLGKGKTNQADVSRSGYDFSLLAALIIRGITDPSALATILYRRPNSKAKDHNGTRYLRHTIGKALATFKRPKQKYPECELEELKKRFHKKVKSEEVRKLKTIAVKTPGGREIQDLEIKPGTTARDILDTLNLSGYRLRRPGSSDPNDTFGDHENVYSEVKDGEKLLAHTDAKVG